MKKQFLYFAALLTLLLGSPVRSWAQGEFFADAPDLRAATRSEKQVAAYRVYRLNVAGLRAYLANAPVEFTGDRRPALNLAVPLPNGTTETFAIYDSPILAPAVAAQHPDIKTYTGRATSGAPATIRFSLMSDGFNAVVLGLAGGASAYFEKSGQVKEDNVYLSYSTLDVLPLPRGPGAKKAQCGVPASIPRAGAAGVSPVGGPAARLANSGGTLRTFRLAVAATGEFTANFGGTPATAFNALVGYVNRLVGVYRQELSVSFTLVSSTSVVYPDATTDPYTPTNQSLMLTQNQTNLDAVVGSGNYDLGHVIDYAPAGTSGGGLGALGSTCDNASKAQGVSQVIPVGGAYPIIFGDQTFNHEVGHQVGMSHSFNSSIPVCTTRNQPTAMEPGAGTTIMSYGYTCSDATGDDNYEATYLPILNFHAVNLQEANAFLATTSCFTSTNPGNAVPVIGAFTTGRTIPKSTPFALTATATDANAADVLSYSWESMDAGAVAAPGPGVLADESQAPFFRTYAPVAAGTRLFPRLSAILDGTNKGKGDKLPAVSAVTNLRLTVRDGVGGVNEVNSVITVDGSSGPFLITSNLAGSYVGNTVQTVTWSVNNTTAAPVSCANVDILLSTDGGQTFPITLLAATPNDGSEPVTLPALATPTTTARLKVQASNNIFFDISNADFAITAALNSVSTGPVSGSPFCAGSAVSVPYNSTGTYAAGNTFTAQLSDASGTFATPVVIGSVSSVAATGNIAATLPASAGTGTGYRIRVVASDPALTGSDNGANLTITAPPVATFSYGAASALCTSQTAAQAATLGTGATAGAFTSTTGLTLNATTGAITPATSTPGTYTVTNTVAAAGGCAPATATTTVTITAAPVAAFAYPTATTYCAGSTSSVTPTLGSGATAGTFSSTMGLSIDATTGVITLSTSTAGTYTVTNTVAASGTCAAVLATTMVTITPANSAAFTYPTGTTFCASGPNPTATVTGTTGGTFSTTSGLSLDATTGTINLSASTIGTYTVTYTVASNCGSSATATVTITAAPVAAFSYASTTYCGTGTNPAPVLSAGASAGNFLASLSGLVVNVNTGIIDLTASTPGTYTVTNSVGAASGCAAATATTTVTITAAPTAAFSYATTTGCAGATTAVTPTLGIGASAGTYSSTSGLVIDATTGAITLATSTAGTYTVTNTVAAAGGCAAATATATFTVNPRPATPTVTATYSSTTTTLTSSATTGNQWSLNGAVIAGATGQTYVVNGLPAQFGSYTVVVTNANGCASLSSTALVITAARNGIAGASLLVYPNPTPTGQVTLALTGYRLATQLTVLDALGRVLISELLPANAGTATRTLDLKGVTTGVYLLRLRNTEGVETRRLVRE